MAIEVNTGQDIGFMTAAADLSGSQYRIVKVTADKQVNLGSSAGETVLGVLQNDPKSGEAALVRTGGVSKVVAGGTLSAGDKVQTDANGAAITALTGDFTVGQVLIGAASGEIATILVSPSGGQIN